MDSVDYYNKYANVYFDSTVELDMTDILNRFLEHMSPGDSVLDLGCGSGRDGKLMMEEGIEVTFLDASEELCELADIYTTVEPLCMDYRDMEFTDVFDGIWACASLLHITKQELPQVLDKIATALKQEGIFYMSVEKGDFEGFRNERFFADYTVSELKKMLKAVPSFEILDIWETSDVRSNREEEWVNVLVQKNA